MTARSGGQAAAGNQGRAGGEVNSPLPQHRDDDGARRARTLQYDFKGSFLQQANAQD